MGLQEYKKKRNFKATPEPEGQVQSTQEGNSFVIQKHAATRLHYDFRLEMEGVLRSWAVPKGPSLDPGEKRLAVHVEDHPLDYGTFEGIIPKGQYGGGTVLLWDRGTWHPEGDPVAGYKKGHLRFRLDGEKLQGGWDLVRLGGRRGNGDGEKQEWLLIKVNDETAQPGSGDAIVEERPESVATGLSLEEIAADPERVWESNRAQPASETASFKDRIAAKAAKTGAKGAKKTAKKALKAADAAKKEIASGLDPAPIEGARKAALPAKVEAQLATLVDGVPQGEEWVHEIKFDGYRCLCHVKDGDCRIITRNGKDWSDRFAPVARAAADLPVQSAILDGEVVVLEPNGTTSFQALQNALTENRDRDLVYYAFDLLYLDGYDLRKASLLDRKAALGQVVGPAKGTIRYSDHVTGDGEAFYRQACDFSLEGIIAKRGDLPYHGGRNKDWLKIKCLKRQEFVIVGFTDPEGSRVGFGALWLAVNEGGKLVSAGKVGTGFNDQLLRGLRKRLDKMVVPKPAFENPPRGAEARRSHWVRPELVAEVAFTEWTRDGILRHPAFQGLREDKDPRDVVHERPQDLPDEAEPEKAAKKSAKTSAKKTAARPAMKKGPKPPLHPAPEEKPLPSAGKKKEVEISGVRFSNPDKVLFPEEGVTKRDLGVYYSRIADWILPHIKDRPLTIVRCPEGRTKQCFYQKHINEHVPPSVRRVEIAGDPEPYGAVSSLEGILSLAQMGVLEFHIWGSHRDKIELPDYVVFDLDPDEGLAWERVVEAAYQMRDFLDGLGLRSFLKTTGGKGLHVVLPLTRKLDWDEVKAFTKAVTETVVAANPGRYTSKLPKASRKGKIFIDYLRNGRGATSICAYSTRARLGATVSTPLFWEELEQGVRADSFTVKNLPERLEKLPADPWEEFFKVRQSITAAMKKAVGMK
jgi:bifunctional non-homologous end joining protein LigD